MRRSLECAGMSPKALARVSRFQRAIGEYRSGHSNWLDIAHKVGYYDQMHLVRDSSLPEVALASLISPPTAFRQTTSTSLNEMKHSPLRPPRSVRPGYRHGSNQHFRGSHRTWASYRRLGRARCRYAPPCPQGSWEGAWSRESLHRRRYEHHDCRSSSLN